MPSLWCGFAHVSFSGLILRCSCHTLNIWKASLLCGFSHLSSSCLLVRMSSCTWRIWMASLLYGSSQVLFSGLISRSSCHTSSIWKASLLFESSHAPSRNLILKNTCHLLCTWMASLLCGLICLQVTWYWEALVPLCALEWLLLRVPSRGYIAIEKLLSHFKDLKGFNSCVSPLMLLKELDLEKHLSHFVHLNGFSPVWSPVSPRNFMLRADWRPRHFEWLPLYSKKLFYRSTCPQSRG